MKRIVTVLIVVASLISCQHEELVESTKTMRLLKVYMEGVRNETKTMIGEDNQIVWSEGDEIKVIRGPYYGIYEIEPECVGTSYGIFTTQFEDTHFHDGVNVAVYPSDLYSSDKENTSNNELASNEYKINCHLPPSQDYCFDNISNNSFPMVAVTTSPEDDVLNFKNLCGVMKLQLKGDAIIESIVIQGNDNEKLSGYFDVIASARGLPRVIMAEDAYESVRLDCGEGVKLDKDKTKNFYISIPPVVYEKGFKVTVTDTDGDKYVIEATAKNQVERSSILVMPVIDLADFAVESGDDDIIDFRDPVVKEILVRQGVDRNGDGEISYSEATRVTTLSFVVDGAREQFDQYDIVEFDEFQYFTGIKDVTEMFFGCDKLQSITLPESLSEIGESAFCWCDSLRSVTIPNSVKIIGKYAFGGCSSLEYIGLPESLEIIDEGAFSETNLKSIVLPDSVKIIGEYAFSFTPLNSIIIPESITEIGDGAFLSTQLVSIELPASLEIIGAETFSHTPLASITIPESVIEIGEFAFYSTQLVSIELPTSLKVIGAEAFNDTPLTSILIPESVIEIGELVFYGCRNLMEINVNEGNQNYFSLDGVLCSRDGTLLSFPVAKPCSEYKIPEGVMSIGEMAFEDCSQLSVINIPEGITTIGYRAFGDCQRLKIVHVPSTLERVGISAFDGCNDLSNVYISDIAKWCCVQFPYTEDLDSNPLYRGADLYLNGERITKLTIPEGVTEVGNSFTGCGSIEEVVVPEGVKSISQKAFRGCFNLTSISLPSSLESIGASAFVNCDNLSSVYITDLAKWCSVELNEFLYYLGYYEEGVFPNPLSKGADLYLNNEKVIDLIIPSSVRTLGNSFTGCGSIISVTIPATTTTIKDNAFEGCSNLENIYMMSETAMSVEHIGLDDRMYINVPADSHDSYLSKNSNVQHIVAYYYGKSWGLSGTFNEWGETSDIEMVEEGGYYVARNVELLSDTEFKFRLDNSWDKNYGAISSAAVVENTLNKARSYGSNIKITKPGCYDIYLSKHYDEYFIMTSGKFPDEL